MEDNFFEMILAEKEKKEMAVLMACNEKTETFGLSLTEQEEQDYFAGIGRELAVRMMQAAKSAE